MFEVKDIVMVKKSSPLYGLFQDSFGEIKNINFNIDDSWHFSHPIIVVFDRFDDDSDNSCLFSPEELYLVKNCPQYLKQ